MKSTPTVITDAIDLGRFEMFVLIDVIFKESGLNSNGNPADNWVINNTYPVGEHVLYRGERFKALQENTGVAPIVGGGTDANPDTTWQVMSYHFTDLAGGLPTKLDGNVGYPAYSRNNGLSEYSPPQLTTVLDREVYRLQFTDLSDKFLQDVTIRNSIGGELTVRMGVNPVYSDLDIETTYNGVTQPKFFNDLDILYKGRIDGLSVTTDFGSGSKELVMEGSSPFADLDLTIDRETSKRSQDNEKLSPTDTLIDTCYNELYDSVKGVEVRWGKK